MLLDFMEDAMMDFFKVMLVTKAKIRQNKPVFHFIDFLEL